MDTGAAGAPAIVNNGGFKGFSWAVLGTDTVIGGAVPGLGAAGGAAGVGNVVGSWASGLIGGIGSAGCAFSGGIW